MFVVEDPCEEHGGWDHDCLEEEIVEGVSA